MKQMFEWFRPAILQDADQKRSDAEMRADRLFAVVRDAAANLQGVLKAYRELGQSTPRVLVDTYRALDDACKEEER